MRLVVLCVTAVVLLFGLSADAVEMRSLRLRGDSVNGMGAGDVLLEKKKAKKKKGKGDDDGDGAGADAGAAQAVSAPVNANATATPTPAPKAASSSSGAGADSASGKKPLEVTPCLMPGMQCNQMYMGTVMPGLLGHENGWEPGQFVNGRFVKGKTFNGVFYPSFDNSEEIAKKKKKEQEEKDAKAAKERKEKEEKEEKLRKESLEHEDKERKEKFEQEERKIREHRERIEKEDKEHQAQFEKEQAERKHQREREEEEYLRKKEDREAEERRVAREKERDERLERDRKKQQSEEEERQKEIEAREKKMQEKIAKLEAENLAEQKKIADELKMHTDMQIRKALNEKQAAHLLGENADKWGFVSGAKEAAEDTKQAIEFNKDVMDAVKKQVQDAMAKAFTRGQIKQLAIHRGKVEATQKIEEAYNAGIQAALRKIAQEEQEKAAEDALLKRAKSVSADSVTLPDGRVLTSTPAKPLWAYAGTQLGPTKWGGICNTGFAQSPVNVYGVLKTDPEGAAPLKPIDFNYEPTQVNVEYSNHSIRLMYDRGSSMTANGVTYDLKYVEFHTPSEHFVRGLHFPLEVQLHHFGRENPAIKAVVSLLSTEGPKSGVLDLFWDNLPTIQGDLENVEGVNFNVADLLPLSRGYFAYAGSSTRPPCTEGVQWFVMSHYITASPQQIQKLLDITGPNNRPIQVPNDRKIRQYSPEDKEEHALAAEAAAEKKAVAGSH